MRYQISAVSEKGPDKHENQDNILVESGETVLGYSVLVAVADGVGGLEQGTLASKIAVDCLKQWWDISFKSIMYRDADNIKYLISESLSAVIHKANLEIYEQGLKQGKQMATTLSAAFILNDWYCIKHIGDSRIYLIKGDLYQLTEDHSLLQQYLKSGSIEKVKCNLKALDNVLTKCLGIKQEAQIQEINGKMSDSAGFLFCTDGLYKLLSLTEISSAVEGSKICNGDLEGMLLHLINKARKRGERDDISAAIMAVKRKQEYKWTKIKKLILGR